MPEQFPYPETGWSTGKMRKNGSLMGTGWETPTSQPEMTPNQRVFEAFSPDLGESASGRATKTPTDQQMLSALTPIKLKTLLDAAHGMGNKSLIDAVGEWWNRRRGDVSNANSTRR